MTGNRMSYKLLGLTPGSNVSKSADKEERPENFQVRKDGREITAKELPVQRAAAGQVVRDFEWDLVFPDGTIRHLLGNAVPLLEESGRPRGAVAAFVDITERKQAVEALRESEQKFRLMAESIQDVFWLGDLGGGKITYISPAYEQVWGRSRDSLYNSPQSFFEAIHPEDRDRVAATISGGHSLESGFDYEYRIILPDGTTRWIHDRGFPIGNEQGEIKLFTGLATDITERKQAEAAVARLASFPQLNPDPVLELDSSSGRITYCNPAAIQALEKLGVSKGPQAFLPPDMDQILKTPEEENVSRFYREVQIKEAVFAENIEFVPQYKVTRIRAFDITEQKRAEAALRNERDFIAALLQTLGALVIVFDRAGRVVRFNRACEQATGYTFQEVEGKLIFDLLLLPEETEETKAVFQKLMTGDFPCVYENHWMVRDGERRLFSWSNTAMTDDQGQIRYIIGTGIDITERRQAEESLRESETKYQFLIDNLSDGIILADLDGNILDTNRKIEELLDYSKAELLCMKITQIHPEEDLQKLIADFQEGVRSGGGNISTTRILRKDKTKIPVEISGRRIEFGGKTLMQGVFRDISERQKSEEDRLRFSKLESLSILAGGIAHDFNNILTAILGNIGLAMLNGKIEPQVQDTLAQAEQACLRAQALSRKLLTFAKGGAPIKEIISIANLLKESANLTLSGSKSRHEVSIPNDLWSVEADEGQINQVISNLLINADQAMPEGGVIKITAENILVKAESNLPLSEGKYVKFAIADQGIGISPKYLGKIFDPYFSTKQKGSGLGLATAYSIIKNHSGHIQVESQIGVGTTFHIYLPATGKGVPAESLTVKPAMGQGKVLIMDDEAMVREVLGRMLSRLGYEVDFASDGSQAIEKFVTAKETNQPFDAVILDLTVPGGMGGKEAIQDLLKINPKVKAIVSSGYSEDPIMAEFQKYGFSEVIAKPYRVSEMSKILQKVISK